MLEKKKTEKKIGSKNLNSGVAFFFKAKTKDATRIKHFMSHTYATAIAEITEITQKSKLNIMWMTWYKLLTNSDHNTLSIKGRKPIQGDSKKK
jgi:hypothetical protein